jgi:hypothetical protein
MKGSVLVIAFFLANVFFGEQQLFAAEDSSFIIQNIAVYGNKKTKASIITRELGFALGDTVKAPNLHELMKNARQQLINTSLFLEATVSFIINGSKMLQIEVRVKERWYVFPVPVFSLADNNFNVWWNQQMRKLNRINIGMAIEYTNVTGRRDLLSVGFQTGFANGCGIYYSLPGFGYNKRHGIGAQARFINTREVIYGAKKDLRTVLRETDFIIYNKEVKLWYTYRKKINTQHKLMTGYSNIRIADTVTKLNPSFLGNGRSQAQYVELSYRLKHIRADNWQYPLKGYSVLAEITKVGILKWNDINTGRLLVNAGWYLPLSKNWYTDVNVKGSQYFNASIPFIKQQAVGYDANTILRGLDYYVLNGQAYVLIKSNLKKMVLDRNITLRFLPSEFEKIPVRLFLKALGDAGYVSNNIPDENSRVNRWLHTWGLGADLVTYYDAAFSFEYSRTKWGRPGFFVRMSLGL